VKLLRNAGWHEVVRLFPTETDAIRNADGWAARFKVPLPNYRDAKVTLEAWDASELRAQMEWMSEYEPRMTVDMDGATNNATLPPRVDGLPAVVVKFGNRYGMIDGKHRANRWKETPGLYAVLVVHA
jgi:hypothetical protein